MTTERRPIPGNRCNSDGIHWAAAIRWCPETSTAHSWPTALRTASTTRSALRGAGRLWNISLSLRGLCAKSNCQRVLTGSDSCLGSCGTHRRVSHQRQCRRKFSVSAVTSDRAGLSKPASSEKLLIYRNLLNNQEVVLSFEQVSIFLAVPREMPEFICSVGGNPDDYTKTPKSHRKFRPCRSRLLLKDFVAIDGGMLQVIRLNYSLRKRCGFADPAATASLGEYPRCRV